MCHCRCKQNIMKVERISRDKVKAKYEFEDYSQLDKHDDLSGVPGMNPIYNFKSKAIGVSCLHCSITGLRRVCSLQFVYGIQTND